MICPSCQKDYPDDDMKLRLEFLKVVTCKNCTPQKAKPIGVLDFPENYHERNEGSLGLVVIEGKPGKRR